MVGALIIPDERKSEIERRYSKISQSFPRPNGEVKGKLLNEKQISTVIEMLIRSEVVFEATAFDTSLDDPGIIKDHQLQSGFGVTKNLTDDHYPNLRKEAYEVRRQIELSVPLYLQTLALLDLVDSVIRDFDTLLLSTATTRIGCLPLGVRCQRDKQHHAMGEAIFNYRCTLAPVSLHPRTAYPTRRRRLLTFRAVLYRAPRLAANQRG